MNKKLLLLSGSSGTPFSQDVPVEALRATPRIEQLLLAGRAASSREGGFALITGDAGLGK